MRAGSAEFSDKEIKLQMHANKHRFTMKFIWLSLALFLSVVTYAQQAQPKSALPLNVENHKLNSRLMRREMSYRVVLPNDYKKSANDKTAYPVVYLLHGLTGHFNNWTDKSKLAEYAVNFQVIAAAALFLFALQTINAAPIDDVCRAETIPTDPLQG